MKGPLLCDLDGTIADTAPAIFASLRITCDALGIELTPERELSWSLGPPLHWCLAQLGVGDDRMVEAVAIFERAHLDAMHLVTAMPGADVVIRELAGAGFGIGVATIKPDMPARLVLERVGLTDCIASLHARADDMDARTKTDLVRAALADLPGTSPLYVGDHDNDEIAAAECGIPFLRYPDHSWDEIRAAMLDLSPTS